jgi:hypothetical protein
MLNSSEQNANNSQDVGAAKFLFVASVTLFALGF